MLPESTLPGVEHNFRKRVNILEHGCSKTSVGGRSSAKDPGNHPEGPPSRPAHRWFDRGAGKKHLASLSASDQRSFTHRIRRAHLGRLLPSQHPPSRPYGQTSRPRFGQASRWPRASGQTHSGIQREV